MILPCNSEEKTPIPLGFFHIKHDPIEKRKEKKNLHFLFNGAGGTLPLLAPEKDPLNDMGIKENKSK